MPDLQVKIVVPAIALVAMSVVAWLSKARERRSPRKQKMSSLPSGAPANIASWKPVSVNWHFTRVCNYSCRFCFHTHTEGHLTRPADAKRGLALLQQSGMQKINFSGGEPFLYKRYLGDMVKFCKQELRLSSVSIVSNGSLIDAAWMEKYAQFVDILAVSCDSFDPDVLRATGRQDAKGQTDHIKQTMRVRDWCEAFGVVFKMNTVVTALNAHEDLSSAVKLLKPKRWKVFQVLPIEGENIGNNPTDRNATDLEITQEAFEGFIERHRADSEVAKVLVPEDNAHMRDSYLILDQRMRFLDCTSGEKVPGECILDVGVDVAVQQAGHDPDRFLARGGMYKWTKEEMMASHDVEEVPQKLLER